MRAEWQPKPFCPCLLSSMDYSACQGRPLKTGVLFTLDVQDDLC